MAKRRDWSNWGFGGPFFREFQMLDDLLERMLHNIEAHEARGEQPEPLMWGFTMERGPDGEPRVRQFGNTQPAGEDKLDEGVREPFTSTITDEERGRVTVTAEMPGAAKEQVHVRATGDTLILEAKRDGRQYFKQVELGVSVDPDSARARYNNGVLEVTLDLRERAEGGREVEVE